MNEEKTILVVEDELDIREAIVEALTEAGFKVLAAQNGAVGLEVALTERPDMILLDLVMPVLDGQSTLKKLRQNPWGKSVKVIILSSMDDVKNIANAHEEKITDYLIKTHNSLDEIVNKVRENLYA
jgi:DNA-binding response OmpR family regulator